MFNGIIYHQGTIKKILKRKKGINLFINTNINLTHKDLGISIACNGICLTLISVKKKLFEFYLSHETIKRSNFRKSKFGDKINLELPIKFGQKISGHLCQGHVDTVGKVRSIKKIDKSAIFSFHLPSSYQKYIVEKGSICLDGISLTVASVADNEFTVAVIPHTIELTNWNSSKAGDLVNLEVDIMSKYVESLMSNK